ncbi:glycosyltransferase family 2 protein [Marinomonas sp.]|uniref:glycosyltransferase family 2 protein n=1 Tax=Marinomonas sp. TaxID=1904862 RepID=UPI003BAC3568
MRDIDIVMASYNGADYIAEQIFSMMNANSFHEKIDKIIVSDDNSIDGTAEILNSLDFERIDFSLNNGENGVIYNFANAFSKSTADYIIISDQDDVWLNNKIDVLYKGIKSIEINKKTPALFFTDLKVVDQDLNVMSGSFWDFQKIDPKLSESLKGVLLKNISPGCAMIINRALLLKAQPFPRDILMHDWWLLLVAKVFGSVGFSEEKTFLYRQHDKNVLGARRKKILEKLGNFISNDESSLDRVFKQAVMLDNLLPDENENKEVVKSFFNSKEKSYALKFKFLFNFFNRKLTFSENFSLFVWVFSGCIK